MKILWSQLKINYWNLWIKQLLDTPPFGVMEGWSQNFMVWTLGKFDKCSESYIFRIFDIKA